MVTNHSFSPTHCQNSLAFLCFYTTPSSLEDIASFLSSFHKITLKNGASSPRASHAFFFSLNEKGREFVVQLLAHAGHDFTVPARIVAQCARHVLIGHVFPLAFESSPHLGKLVLPGRVEPKESLGFVDPVEVLAAVTGRIIEVFQDEFVEDWLVPLWK